MLCNCKECQERSEAKKREDEREDERKRREAELEAELERKIQRRYELFLPKYKEIGNLFESERRKRLAQVLAEEAEWEKSMGLKPRLNYENRHKILRRAECYCGMQPRVGLNRNFYGQTIYQRVSELTDERLDQIIWW